MSSIRGSERSMTGKGGPSPDILRFRAKGEGVGFAEIQAAFAARHQLEGEEVPGATDLAHDVVAFDE